MTIRKVRSVVEFLTGELKKLDIKPKRMPERAHFSTDLKKARRQMLSHAYWLLTVSMPELLSDKKRINSKSGHGKIGRHLGSIQVLLWTAGMYTRIEIMNQNWKGCSSTS